MMNGKLFKGIFWGLLFSAPIWFSIIALADFTVGKPMYEAFQMFNSDGSARTNCTLSRFTTKTWINEVPTAMTWTFRNQSTGDYDAIGTPSAPGDVKLLISYSGISVTTCADNVRFWDIDTMYGSAGPRFADISANLVGSATAFVATRTMLTNITGAVTRTKSIPTNPLLTNDTRLNYLNAPISAIPTNPELATDSKLNYLDAAISSRMAAGAVNVSFSGISSAVQRNAQAIAGIPTMTYGNRFTNMSGGILRNAQAIVAIPNYGPRFSNSSTAIARGFSAVPADVWGAGTRTLTTTYVNATSINSYLVAQHGSGQWGIGSGINILPFQGAASYETVAQGNDIHVTYGDSVSIPYSIGTNITGYTVWFGVKATPQDTTYAIAPRDVTAYVTSASTGAGLIELSTTDTALPVRKYAAQVEIKNGSTVNTVLKFNLFIDASVLN